MIGAFLTAISAAVNNYLNLKPAIKSLEDKVAFLEQQHHECEEHRRRLQEKMDTEWPSDRKIIDSILQHLKEAGIRATTADVIRVLEYRKQCQTKVL